jgi:phosphoribosylformylglycinamidine (FGAM) synthase-like amidotransferase family enzyme
MIYVLSDIMEQEVVELWHKDTDLQGVDAIILPGGFSYGDYLRSGAIARFSPIMDNVIRFAQAFCFARSWGFLGDTFDTVFADYLICFHH